MDPTYSVLSTIRDAVNTQALGPPAGDFAKAVEGAVDYVNWHGGKDADDHSTLHRETIAHAKTVRRVQRKFAEKSTAIDTLKTRQAAVVEKLALHMGGREIARRLFQSLLPTWNHLQERYHDVLVIPRINEPLDPRMPTAHLLNLSIKYPHPKKPIRRSDDDWTRLVQECKDFAALYKTQPVGFLDIIFMDHTSLLTQLERKALEDSLFRIPQQRPSDIGWILRTMIDQCEARGFLQPHQRDRLDMFVAVVGAIQKQVCGVSGPAVFRTSDVQRHTLHLSVDEVGTILNEQLSSPPGTANKRYGLPDEVPDDAIPREERCGPTFGERPLVALERDFFWLLDNAVCAPAYIEVQLSQLREMGVDDGRLGFAFEDTIGALLQQHGIHPVSGFYDDGGKEWECDLVFETPDCVFFLETKKKTLTRKSRAGMTLGLLLDIGQSMVHAVLQGLRHERKLRTDKRLELRTRSGGTHVIELNGRSVEVIAVTLQEFGGFHDRTFLDRALAAHISVRFSVEAHQYRKKVKELNAHGLELSQVISELTNLRPGRPGVRQPNGQVLGGSIPFMNCWFLSLPHLLIALDDVSSPIEFKESLFLTRHSNFQVSDFFFDRIQMKKLRAGI
ncbi:MAG: hypothetical protein Q7K57_48250 [Burkholderiaceae bacterium]|nr:hypothetical protein [Burkholderiaceae bacterium]